MLPFSVPDQNSVSRCRNLPVSSIYLTPFLAATDINNKGSRPVIVDYACIRRCTSSTVGGDTGCCFSLYCANLTQRGARVNHNSRACRQPLIPFEFVTIYCVIVKVITVQWLSQVFLLICHCIPAICIILYMLF